MSLKPLAPISFNARSGFFKALTTLSNLFFIVFKFWNWTFQTNLLKGSFKESLTKKIKFPAYDYELIYYNSQDYFLGSGGGEIFSYIINFKNQKTFYAHLFLEKEKISLFLSNNIDNSEIKNFFIANFKRDYPNLQIVSKDVNIDI